MSIHLIQASVRVVLNNYLHKALIRSRSICPRKAEWLT